MSSIQKWIVPLFGLWLISTIARADDVKQGHALYLQYCSSCHGLTGEGDGPMARILTTPPANLRLLSDRYGNPVTANESGDR